MIYSDTEIEKARELKRMGFQGRLAGWEPQLGQYLHGRECPPSCREIAPGIFLIVEAPSPGVELKDYVWLPTWDELLVVARKLGLSFSFITDFLHRRRFADGREREGFYQIFIEHLR